MNTTRQNLLVIEMAADPRIPENAIGYVYDLQSSALTDAVRCDRLQQLSRYVPDLVDQFRQG